jgi:hypothetical protein
VGRTAAHALTGAPVAPGTAEFLHDALAGHDRQRTNSAGISRGRSTWPNTQ